MKILGYVGLAELVGVQFVAPVQGRPFGLVLEKPHCLDVL